jgi:glycosyltransferase involved in cell wall biosynthesis
MSGEPAIVIVTVLRERGFTGVQSHVAVFRRYLREQGSPVRVVTPFQNGRWLVLPVIAVRRVVEAISPSLGVRWYRRGHSFLLRRSLRRVLAGVGPAVVYAQDPVSAEAALDVRGAAGPRVVMAAHFNVSQADEWAGKGRIRAGGRAWRSIRAHDARVLPGLDGIVHVSADVRRHVEALVPAAAGVPAVVVPNFAYPPPECGPAAPGAGDRPAATDLVSVGSLEPRKNQGYLLEILAEAARLGVRPTLTLIGDGPDRRALAGRAESLGVAPQVSMAGVVPLAAHHLHGYRLYCHAARMESFGMAILEAMAAGLPVIAAPVGGIPEVFRDRIEGRYWPLDDAPAAARILVEALADEAALREMAAAARDRFDSSFDARGCAPVLAAFLRQRAG